MPLAVPSDVVGGPDTAVALAQEPDSVLVPAQCKDHSLKAYPAQMQVQCQSRAEEVTTQ